MISAKYENNSAVVTVVNEASRWFCIKSGVKDGCSLSPFIGIVLTDFVVRRKGKVIGEHGIKWGRKTFLDLDYRQSGIKRSYLHN